MESHSNITNGGTASRNGNTNDHTCTVHTFLFLPYLSSKSVFFVFNAPCFSEFEKTWHELILWLVMQHKVWRIRGTELGRKSLGVGKKIGGKCLQIWNSVWFQKHGCLQRCTVLVKFYPFSLCLYSAWSNQTTEKPPKIWFIFKISSACGGISNRSPWTSADFPLKTSASFLPCVFMYICHQLERNDLLLFWSVVPFGMLPYIFG